MKKYISVGLLAVIALFGCSKGGKVVARVGKETITLKAVEERLQEAPASYQGYLSTNAGKKQFVDLMVRERIVLESAKAAGFDRKGEYKKSLEDMQKEQERRVRDYRENLLMELYIRDLHDSKQIGATDEEVTKYYNDHIDEYTHPKTVLAQHILVPTMAEAEKALARVKGGEDFSKVAKEISTDPISAARGGEIGPFKKGDLVPEFEAAVFPLKNGQISGIVETQFGFHIIRKLSEKSLPPESLDLAKADIKKILEKDKFDKWLATAKKKQNVTVNYDMVNTIVLPQAGLPQGALPPVTGPRVGKPSPKK